MKNLNQTADVDYSYLEAVLRRSGWR